MSELLKGQMCSAEGAPLLSVSVQQQKLSSTESGLSKSFLSWWFTSCPLGQQLINHKLSAVLLESPLM